MKTAAALALAALASCGTPLAYAVTFDWASVGNAGNAADPTTGFGAVAYNYSISTTEVTNAQYAEFLNAVAVNDSFGGEDNTLYNFFAASDDRAGIVQIEGDPGSYSYTTKSDMADKPVIYVSFFDAMRFANWLHNGQGDGDTETGAYNLSEGVSPARLPGAKYWIPSEDEWYKAAYHQPALQGGDADDYWLYPTASNTAPALATADGVGDISNPGANVANYSSGADWNGQDGNVTTVRSAGPSSSSYYGTFDQGGNVFEWNESISGVFNRGLRGGSWVSIDGNLRADNRFDTSPSSETIVIGFRVARIPEPGSILLGALVSLGVAMRRNRSGVS